RRHTRFSRDWSSDVCSSDLARYYVIGFSIGKIRIDQDVAGKEVSLAYPFLTVAHLIYLLRGNQNFRNKLPNILSLDLIIQVSLGFFLLSRYYSEYVPLMFSHSVMSIRINHKTMS